MTRVVPMLAYADAPAAIDFLCRAFGFEVTLRMDGEDGSVGHAELVLGVATVMVATVWREAGFATPHELGRVHSQVWCEVESVDDHFRRAVAEGAVVIGEPATQDYGLRTYRAVDGEGHRWFFGSQVAGG